MKINLELESRLWPTLLIAKAETDVTTKSEDGYYEGFFMIGLQLPGKDTSLPVARIEVGSDILNYWLSDVRQDDLTTHDYNISGSLHPDSEISDRLSPVPCPTEWPRTILKPEDGHREQGNESSSGVEKTKKGKRKSKTLPKEVACQAEKGVRLRPASDVLNRLRYDRNYDIDGCVVGYKDRHTSRIMEKPVSEWSSETTDEEFIPEHRIEYFKLNQGLIWKKTTKLDKMFNSGNGSSELKV
jgi:uncharacterized protein (UPF0248 family)